MRDYTTMSRYVEMRRHHPERRALDVWNYLPMSQGERSEGEEAAIGAARREYPRRQAIVGDAVPRRGALTAGRSRQFKHHEPGGCALDS